MKTRFYIIFLVLFAFAQSNAQDLPTEPESPESEVIGGCTPPGINEIIPFDRLSLCVPFACRSYTQLPNLNGDLTIEDPSNVLDFSSNVNFCVDMGDLSLAFLTFKYDHCGIVQTKTVRIDVCNEESFPPNPPSRIADMCCDPWDPTVTERFPFPRCVSAVTVTNAWELSGIDVTVANDTIYFTVLHCLDRSYEVDLLPTFACSGIGSPITWTINVEDPEVCGSGFRSSASNEAVLTKAPPFSVFPNPVKDVLNIQLLDQNIKTFEILDVSGRLITQPATNSTNVDVSKLQSGLYLIRMQDAAGQLHTQKFVKY
ncbi:MAG: T9SS type A sorting domain-containing protein [Bacteroidota bacterium]